MMAWTAKRFVVPIAVAVVMLVSAEGRTSPVLTFTEEQAFIDAVGALSFEGFENTPAGGTGTSRVLDGFILGPLPESDGTLNELEIVDDPALAFEGRQFVRGNRMFLAFGSATTALGFAILNASGSPGTTTLALNDGGVPIDEIAFMLAAIGSYQFFGILSNTPFTGAHITTSVPSDLTAVDAVHYGGAQPVPEPSVLSLFGLAVLCLGWRELTARSMPRAN